MLSKKFCPCTDCSKAPNTPTKAVKPKRKYTKRKPPTTTKQPEACQASTTQREGEQGRNVPTTQPPTTNGTSTITEQPETASIQPPATVPLNTPQPHQMPIPNGTSTWMTHPIGMYPYWSHCMSVTMRPHDACNHSGSFYCKPYQQYLEKRINNKKKPKGKPPHDINCPNRSGRSTWRNNLHL